MYALEGMFRMMIRSRAILPRRIRKLAFAAASILTVSV